MTQSTEIKDRGIQPSYHIKPLWAYEVLKRSIAFYYKEPLVWLVFCPSLIHCILHKEVMGNCVSFAGIQPLGIYLSL